MPIIKCLYVTDSQSSSSLRSVEIPVIKDQTVVVNTTPGFEFIPTNLEESAKYSFAAYDVFSGFRHYPSTYANNMVDSDFARNQKMKNIAYAMGNTIEGILATNFESRKTQVLVNTEQVSATSGDYRIHTFTSSGTFTNTISSLEVEYLVIAGGASGGDGTAGGGGGAGGYRSSIGSESSGGGGSTESTLTLSTGAKTVTVGAGGSAPTGTSNRQGNDGSNSVFDTITTIGGGGGGGEANSSTANGRSGGSGGGACFAGAYTGGSGTSNQGYAGGNGYAGSNVGYLAGGGGGAGAAGQVGNTTTYQAGNGGGGIASSATGTSVTRAGGGGGAGDYRGRGVSCGPVWAIAWPSYSKQAHVKP